MLLTTLRGQRTVAEVSVGVWPPVGQGLLSATLVPPSALRLFHQLILQGPTEKRPLPEGTAALWVVLQTVRGLK